MMIVWRADAWTDYVAWQSEDITVLAKLNGLIDERRRDPFRGTGKPEPLRHNLTGWWSQRITGQHRWCTGCAGRGRGKCLRGCRAYCEHSLNSRAFGEAAVFAGFGYLARIRATNGHNQH